MLSNFAEMKLLRISRCIILLFIATSSIAQTDDGYRLWLKYDLIEDISVREKYIQSAKFISVISNGTVAKTASEELQTGLQGLLGISIPIISNPGTRNGGIILNILKPADPAAVSLNAEGYHIAYNLVMFDQCKK
jgi:alpha-glucuronidase